MVIYNVNRGYRRSRRVRWSKQLNNYTNLEYEVNSSSDFSYNIQLCENPTDSNQIVPTPRYFKRVKCSFEIETRNGDGANPNLLEGLTAHIIYIPEGIQPGPGIVKQHPEWVLGSKFYGSLSVESAQNSGKVFTLYTKLCKKLLSGDKIYAVFTGKNSSTDSITIVFNVFIQFYTR